MLEDTDCLSSTKCVRHIPVRTLVFLVLLGFIIPWLGLVSEPISLKVILKRLGDTLDVETSAGESTELDSRLSKPIWDEAKKDSLGWRIQNQTVMVGQTRSGPDYNAWHPRVIDTSEFIEVEPIQPGRLELVSHPQFGETPILVKIADTHEAMMYRLLYDLRVTPSFLGHVTHNGNVVGFITEFIQKHGRSPVPGPASRRQACLAALRRMHARGIVHRDAHGENCLLRNDGSAALIDFELSAESWSRADFDRDLWIMYHTVLD